MRKPSDDEILAALKLLGRSIVYDLTMYFQHGRRGRQAMAAHIVHGLKRLRAAGLVERANHQPPYAWEANQ